MGRVYRTVFQENTNSRLPTGCFIIVSDYEELGRLISNNFRRKIRATLLVKKDFGGPHLGNLRVSRGISSAITPFEQKQVRSKENPYVP